MRKVVIVLAAVFALGLSFVPAQAATVNVKSIGFQYVQQPTPANVPNTISAMRGDTVTLQNLDALPHTLTSVGLICKSGTTAVVCTTGSVGVTATGSFTLPLTLAVGSYQFFCIIHGAALMSAKVNVS